MIIARCDDEAIHLLLKDQLHLKSDARLFDPYF